MGQDREYRVHAVVDHPRSDLGLLDYAQTVAQKSAALNPAPSALAELIAAVAAFAQAIKNAKQQKGMQAALVAARQDVIGALNHLCADGEAIAQKQDPDTGKATIESMGLRCKKVAVHHKPFLDVKFGGISGVVLLVALAVAKRANYFWQYSVDGKQWVDVPHTMRASTVISGLTPATLYYFRFRAETRKAMGDWSQSVTFLVG
jgi:hypothetical protein